MTRRAPNGAPRQWLLANRDFRGEDCLIWPFGISGNGYAQISWNGTPALVHRVMCILVHGDPEPGQTEVAHYCGNRRCVNPRHLRHATWEENSSDKIRHGTENTGERNGMSKLTEPQVFAIRELAASGALSQTEIGRRFGVRGTAVCRILSGKRWSHIADSSIGIGEER